MNLFESRQLMGRGIGIRGQIGIYANAVGSNGLTVGLNPSGVGLHLLTVGFHAPAVGLRARSVTYGGTRSVDAGWMRAPFQGV
jgi:hypothetical protein